MVDFCSPDHISFDTCECLFSVFCHNQWLSSLARSLLIETAKFYYSTAHVQVDTRVWWTCMCSSIFVMAQVKTCMWHKMGCTWVNFRVLHVSQLLCAAHELFFVHCVQVIIPVLHNNKRHASNASCAACNSVFLCAACKLTAIFCQRRIKAYNEKAPQ